MYQRVRDSSTPSWAVASGLLLLVPAVVTGLVWLLALPVGALFSAQGHIWQRWVWYSVVKGGFFPHGLNIFHATIWFWIFVAIWLALTAAFAFGDSDRGSKRSGHVGVIAVVLTVLTVPMMVYSVRNNNLAQAAYYNKYGAFVVRDPNSPPSTLDRLINHSDTRKVAADPSGCVYLRTGDSPACVMKGELPGDWEPRNASAEAAAIQLEKNSSGAGNTTVLDNTLTYLYEDGGVWTAVRDGNNGQSLDRVEEWDGKSQPTACVFSGKYAVKGAFGGSWTNRLKGRLAEDYPGLFFDDNDVWGFCNGSGTDVAQREPVVVIPVTRQLGYGNRTVMSFAGVLTVRGDNGGVKITHIENPSYGTDLSKGQLPGPSYPLSLVENARGSFDWAAGRRNHNRLKFGFEPTNDTAQYGNASEYLLKNSDTGELDWVTPLTTKSGSQEIVAWSITPAGAARSGTLNQTRLYALDDNDSRRVNILTLKGAARNALSQQNPGFFSAGGEIVEFLPVKLGKSGSTGGMWQAYGELNSQVVYRIDVPTSSAVAPTVYQLSGAQAGVPNAGGSTTQPITPGAQPTAPAGGGQPGAAGSNAACGQPWGSQSVTQLQSCANGATGELARRAGQGQTPPASASPKPAASPSR